MAGTANIINLGDDPRFKASVRTESGSQTSAGKTDPTNQTRSVTEPVPETAKTAREMYPLPDADPALGRALALLDEMFRLMELGHTHLNSEDFLGADTEVMKLHSLLPEAFYLADRFGEGFSATILMLQNSLRQLNGELLNIEQAWLLKKMLGDLRNRPHIPFEQALEYEEQLESRGLHPVNESVFDALSVTEIPS